MKWIIFPICLIIFPNLNCATILGSSNKVVRISANQDDIELTVMNENFDISTQRRGSSSDKVDVSGSGQSSTVLIMAHKDNYQGQVVVLENNIRYGSFCFGNILFLGTGHLVDYITGNYRELDVTEAKFELKPVTEGKK